MQENRVLTLVKYIFTILVIASSIYIIFTLIRSIEIIIGFVIISVGILSIIWTLLAKYSLSPKSNLRVFTNNFLACSIAVVAFSTFRVLGSLVSIPWLIFLEFFFIFATFFFFLLASYYIYSIGKEFGFQNESLKIGRILKKRKKAKPLKNRYFSYANKKDLGLMKK